jgi:hypothetical protein
LFYRLLSPSVDKLERDHEAAKYGFIIVELALAITFLHIARSSENEERTRRNRDHAARAYGTARKFLRGAALTPEMSDEVNQRIARIDALIRENKESGWPARSLRASDRTDSAHRFPPSAVHGCPGTMQGQLHEFADAHLPSGGGFANAKRLRDRATEMDGGVVLGLGVSVL